MELNNAETAGAVCVECKSYTIRVDGNKVIQISNEINCTEVINTSLADGCELSMDFLGQKKVRGMVYAIVDREGLLNHLRLTIRWKAKKIGYGDIYADEDISKLKNDLADMDVLLDKDRKIVELYRIVELFENVNREIICLYNSLESSLYLCVNCLQV